MIILDFETNTSTVHDVVEVAALKVDENFKIVDIFHRYYKSEFSENKAATSIHKLTPKALKKLRKKEHPKYFRKDKEFRKFCKGEETLVAHNVSFELRHLGSFSEKICTMKENKVIVEALNKNGFIKNPKLKEVCEFYKIKFDDESYHSAIYDVKQTLKILKKMKKKGIL